VPIGSANSLTMPVNIESKLFAWLNFLSLQIRD
jgi:hypothetical protein